MATLNEICYNIIRLGIGGGIPTDDHRLKKEQVAFWVRNYRARLLKEYYEKNGSINPQFWQDLGCLDIVCVDKADCCNRMVEESWKKLSVEMPELVDVSNGQTLMSVGLIDKVQQFNELSSPQRAFYDKFRKFGKETIKFFQIGKSLYFDLPKGSKLSTINIRAILNDPMDLYKVNKCLGDECVDPYEIEYPMPSYLLQIMSDMIMQKELSFTVKTQVVDDDKNNAAPYIQTGH